MKFNFNTLSGFLFNLTNRIEYNLLGVEWAMTGRSKEGIAPLYGEWCKEMEDSLAGSALDFDWFYYRAMEPDANFSTGAIEGLDNNGAKEAVKIINEIIGKDLFGLAPSKAEGSVIVCHTNVYDKGLLTDVLKNNHEELEEVRDFIAKCAQVGMQGQSETKVALDIAGQ